MHELYPIPDCHIEEVGDAGRGGLRVAVQATHPAASCPACHTTSLSVHSRYRRYPTDLPSFGKEVRLDLLVRRFYCRNPVCPRRTFAEPLPNLLAPRVRRTRRLATAQGGVGVSCGGEAGARLTHRLGMPASADTVPHLVRAIPLPVSKGSRSWHTTRTHPWDVGCRRGVARVSDHANRPVALSMAT
jgi:transposase